MEDIITQIISERTESAKILAKKFPELKGLSWKEFLLQLPIELDFVTACEMYEFLNKKTKKKGK